MGIHGGVIWHRCGADYDYALDVTAEPWSLSMNGRKSYSPFWILIVVAMGFVSPVTLFDDMVESFNEFVGSDAGSDVGLIAPLVLVLSGAALLLFELLVVLWRLEMVIADGEVRVRERVFSGWTNFSEPLANYRGIGSRSELDSGRSGQKFALQFIELVHADARCTVPLLRRKQEEVPETEWRAYAKAFALPALGPGGVG